jgi:hypothetical protein
MNHFLYGIKYVLSYKFLREKRPLICGLVMHNKCNLHCCHCRVVNRGSYWLHAFEDYFSIDFISQLWGNSKVNPWPEKVALLDY